MGGVPFSLLAWIPWEARIAHRFHRKSQQMAQMTQNHLKKGVPPPPFCTFFILYLYTFFPGACRSPKMVFFNPNMGTGLKNPHFGGSYTHSEKNYTRTRWVMGGGAHTTPGPFLGDFWPFGVKVAPNGGSLGHPVGCKVLEKRAPHPNGAKVRGHLEGV